MKKLVKLIKKIKCLNEKFDPNLHQAMLEIENEDVDPGTIIQEIQSGFFYGERLLRPSFVGVAKKKTSNNEEKNDDEIYWIPSKQEIDTEKFEELDAIIHLAGESIAPKDLLGFLPFSGGRWRKERKSRIYWSRKWAADLFVSTYESTDNYPKIFITASGNDI